MKKSMNPSSNPNFSTIFGKVIKRALQAGTTLERSSSDPYSHQQRTLRRLLQKASNTTFGKYYDFKAILKQDKLVNTFQERVPIHDYNLMHDRWWHMSLNNIENVTWRGDTKYFALSSGTTGAASKHIPVTLDMMRAMRRAGLRLFVAMTRFDIDHELFTKGMFMLGGTTSLKSGGGYYEGDLSGINGSKVPFWLRPYYKPGTQISRISDWNARIDEVARRAPEWDVGFMVGIPAWIQLAVERIIEYHGLDTIHDIWPNLRVFVHGGVHMGPYKRTFERLCAKPLIYVDTYLASEGFIALQDRPDTKGMRMLLNNGIFFEFIPFDERHFDETGLPKKDIKPLAIHQVQKGVDYALLLSTCSGAWRYLIGDTVRFTDLERAEILITGRTKHYLNVCGEHLSVDNMNKAIEQVEQHLKVGIPEFTVCAVRRGKSFAHRWFMGTTHAVEVEKAAPVLDQALRQINDDYDHERDKALGLEVEVIPARLFYDWQAKRGKLGGQNKFPRVMKEETFSAWEEFVRQSTGNAVTN